MSHLMPAGVYRLLRDEERKNPHPVMIGQAIATRTAGQIEAPLLCSDCEQRFNNEGERWVLQNCYRGPGDFKILEALKVAEPLYPLNDGAIYAGAQVAGINVDALVYFAASVTWRAAARTWKFLDHHDQLSLGPYFEEFRLFLLGQKDFPVNANVWLNVWPDPVQISLLPRTLKAEGHKHHDFSIPGITFHLFVGQVIPEAIRNACAVRSPERMILLTNEMNSRMLQGVARQVLGTVATGSLRKL